MEAGGVHLARKAVTAAIDCAQDGFQVTVVLQI